MFAARSQFFAQSGGFGNNLLFPNNANQFLSVGSTTNLITWRATTGFTIEYWFYFTSWPATINPGPGNQDGGATNYWSFGPVTSGQVEFYFWSPGQTVWNTNTGVVSLNAWNNISAVFTTVSGTTTGSIYVNGTRQQTQLNRTGAFTDTRTTAAGVVSTGTPFGMGKYGTPRWNGYIDNLRVSNTNRYSGASYTLATENFTADSNTQLLIVPTGSVGSTTIAYQNSGVGGNMTNTGSLVTISDARKNHT